jgi:hypothetical protein
MLGIVASPDLSFVFIHDKPSIPANLFPLQGFDAEVYGVS